MKRYNFEKYCHKFLVTHIWSYFKIYIF